MSQNYTPEFKKKMVRLHEEEGRTYKSITAEYGVSKASISKWCSELREECPKKLFQKALLLGEFGWLLLVCCPYIAPIWRRQHKDQARSKDCFVRYKIQRPLVKPLTRPLAIGQVVHGILD